MKTTLKKNLFVISTPWQLVNAYEAISTFNTENNVLIVGATSNPLNIRQIQALIQPSDWSLIIYLSDNKSNFLQYAAVIKDCKKIHYDKIFINWNWFTQIIFSNVVFNDAYIVDDGLATITHYNEIRLGEKKYQEFFKKKLRFILFGFKVFTSKRISFFTSFSLPNSDNIKIKHHDFQRIRGKYCTNNFQKTKDMFIIGQALTEKNMMSQKLYNQYIAGICRYFQSCNVLYIPHRDEKNIFRYIDSFDGLEFKIIDQPLEIFLLENKTIPRAIVGLFSSVLVNIKQLLNSAENIYYVYVPNSHINTGPYKRILQNNRSHIIFSKINRIELNI